MKGVLSRQFIFLVSIFILIAILISGLISLHLKEVEQDRSREKAIEEIEKSWIPLITRQVWTFALSELHLTVESLVEVHEVESVELYIRGYGSISLSQKIREPSVVREWPLHYLDVGQRIPIGRLTVRLYDPEIFDLLSTPLAPNFLIDAIRAILIILPTFFLVQMAITRQIQKLSVQLVRISKNIQKGEFNALELKRKKIFKTDDEFDLMVAAFNRLMDNIREERYIRLQREEELSKSLREKEVLLKEIHHRVKNNLQIVMSLLHLQSGSVDQPDDQDVLKEAERRIGSLAIVHEQLYSQDDVTAVDVDEFVKKLLGELKNSFTSQTMKDIKTTSSGNPVFIPLHDAIPLALILNELCSNAFEHAFENYEGGEVQVDLQTKGNSRLQIQIKDNGRGLPEDFVLDQAQGFGFTIVRSLVQQLEADFQISKNTPRGSVFTLSLPLEARAN